ncbi:MAG: DUF2339 domain-containing protein, partial [Pseudoalteromonas nigrifaciens]
MDELIGLVGLFILAIIAGAICGFIALTQLKSLRQQVVQLTAKVNSLLQQQEQLAPLASKQAPPQTQPQVSTPASVSAQVKTAVISGNEVAVTKTAKTNTFPKKPSVLNIL